MGNKAYKRLHKKLGLCLDCSEKAVISNRCVKHYVSSMLARKRYYHKNEELISERYKERSARLFAERRCTHCGVLLIEDEGHRCINCNEATHIQSTK